jgi:hypothetical protein
MALNLKSEPQESTSAHALLEVAIRISQQGDKTEARQLLRSYLENHPQDERAWAWYVDTFSDDQKRLRILQVYLKHHPESRFARKAISALRRRLRGGESSAQVEPSTESFQEAATGWPPTLNPDIVQADAQEPTDAAASEPSEEQARPSRMADETRLLILAVSIILITIILAVAWSLLH